MTPLAPRLATVARTRLLWLILPLAGAVAPHLFRLPVWIGLLWLGCAAWRVWALKKGLPLPGRLLRYPLAFAVLAGIYLQFGTLFGPEGGVALLVVLTALKLLETNDARDHVVMVFVGFFLLMTNFLDNQALTLAIYLLGISLLLLASLMSLNAARAQPPLKLLRRSAWLTAQALPLAILLFVFFPRLPTPLGFLKTESAQTGLSDAMQPGSVSDLIQSDAVAFRVDFSTPGINPKQLYWRGPVLWDYDGATWKGRPDPKSWEPSAPLPDYQGLGATIEYTLTLEPHGRRWLFVAGLTEDAPLPGARLTPEFTWLAKDPLRDRRRYSVKSWRDYRLQTELDAFDRRRALALPEGLNPKSQALADAWRQTGDAPRELVTRAQRLFREGEFFYTLRPPLLGQHAVDDFVFSTRRGFCEHYANAFVVLMRMAGVPARVVTGYQGAELNPLGNYWIVRQRDAHAWAEVWLAGQGWVQVDPTASVAPERVEQGVSAALPAVERPVVMFETSWLMPLRQSWDLVNARWHQWVLTYDYTRQRQFLKNLHPDLATLKGMLWGLVVSVAVIVLTWLAFIFRPLRKRFTDPAAQDYARFADKLARIGLSAFPGETPGDFAARIALVRPDLAAEVKAVTRLYLHLRYGKDNTTDLPRLTALVNRFKPGPHRQEG